MKQIFSDNNDEPFVQHLVDYLNQNSSAKHSANLFPIEDNADLELNIHILKKDFFALVDNVTETSLAGKRDRVLRVLYGLFMSGVPLFQIYDKLITPVLHRVGQLWVENQITIMEEHFATQSIRDCLIRLQGSIQIPTKKSMTAFCLMMSYELHDLALKMVDHLLELRGFQVLYSGAMTPSIKIEKVFETYKPERVYIASTIVQDLNLTQAEFDKICYVASDFDAKVFVVGSGFDTISIDHTAVEYRIKTFKDVFEL